MKGKNRSNRFYLVLCLALMDQAIFTAPASSNTNPCNDNRIITTYDKQSPNYHSYSLYSVICEKSQSGCNRVNVFKTMLSQMRFIAPTSSSAPVRDCQETMLERVWPLSGGDPIRTAINNITLSITNYTLPGHIFYPGEVTRSIVELDGSILAWTTGSGTGEYKSLNESVARDIWGSVDRKLARQMELKPVKPTSRLPASGCQSSVDQILHRLREMGASNSNFRINPYGNANLYRSGNPTSRTDELSIIMADKTLGLDGQPKSHKIMESADLKIWATTIVSNCPYTAVVSFGIYKTDFTVEFFAERDGTVREGQCDPNQARRNGNDKRPWGLSFCP